MKTKINFIVSLCAVNLVFGIIVVQQIFSFSVDANLNFWPSIWLEVKSNPLFICLYLQGLIFTQLFYLFTKNEFAWFRLKYNLPRHIYSKDDTGEMIITRLRDIVYFPLLAILLTAIILSQISEIGRLNNYTFWFLVIFLVDFFIWFWHDSFLNKKEYLQNEKPNPNLTLTNQYGG